jgi:AcrR family transcriptional regulator
MPRASSKKRPRRSKAEQRAESIEQILDAAEYLFSQNGLYGVTLRDVAKRVGIHTTLVHYYFDDEAGKCNQWPSNGSARELRERGGRHANS